MHIGPLQALYQLMMLVVLMSVNKDYVLNGINCAKNRRDPSMYISMALCIKT
jgi:hypothetical protein